LDGSQSAPSHSFTTATNTGMFADSKDGEPLAFSVGGVTAGFFDSSLGFNGAVDITAAGTVTGNYIQAFAQGTITAPCIVVNQGQTGFSMPATEPNAMVHSNNGEEYWRSEAGPGGITKQFKVAKPLVSSSTISCGTNAMTSGSFNCTSMTSTGTMSCGTNSMTCGSLSSGSIGATARLAAGPTP